MLDINCYLYAQLFGLPMVLKPTSCWKLDWEDLESNTNNFAAVCKLLKERVSTTHVRMYLHGRIHTYVYVYLNHRGLHTYVYSSSNHFAFNVLRMQAKIMLPCFKLVGQIAMMSQTF